MTEEISITLNMNDWMSVTGALIFLERFDQQGKLKNISDRINSRIISALKEEVRE